ncbi:MAG: twin-arginine translocation signal domain-containing protein [Parabacteroides sp.]|nr:twin-arginine translocation signal domain-containing protein [Parabacteroides sp.]
MTTRRDFIKSATAAGIAASMSSVVFPQRKQSVKASEATKMIWANLIHLGSNMWEDHPYITWPNVSEEIYRDDFNCQTCQDALVWGLRAYRPFLVFEEPVWNTVLQKMSDAGMNTAQTVFYCTGRYPVQIMYNLRTLPHGSPTSGNTPWRTR